MTFVFFLRLIALCGLFSASFLSAHSSTSYGLASSAFSSQSPKSKGPLVVLDAGHGGSDEGAKVRQLQEKRIALLTTLYAKRVLEQMGYRVLLTRSKDTYVSLTQRVSIANKTKAALFVSIHFNSAKNSLAEGVEIFYYKDKDQERSALSRNLANCLLQGVLDQTAAVSRGVKTGNLYVVRETQMPAVLLEAGFMTNSDEWISLRRKSYLEKIAKGIGIGIDQYLKS
jgi:N-acetylmuramoyl-L-alanine amidase